MVSVAGCRSKKIVIRSRFLINGIVQGVGFRPFVYRLARGLDLTGWVRNTPAGVEAEVQGLPGSMASFRQSIKAESPPLAAISAISEQEIPPLDDREFIILPSAGGKPAIQIAPDSALCAECLQELFDPADRRYRYPFINCTNCGPRYSIITGIPYDRPKTTMAGFPMCPDCLQEYRDPENRRFHAQPNACPVCGPRVQLTDNAGTPLAEQDKALLRTVDLLKSGAIVAIKGIGGYHLAVDACNDDAVGRLRKLKKRDEKPFAVMAPDLATAQKLTILTDMEKRLLTGPESPIVIVRKANDCPVSPLVAPDNGWLGLMLPYTPIHHLLLNNNFEALVMTSANSSDEPIVFEDDDALGRLGSIADFFLIHNRAIHIRCDDSVMRVFQGNPLFYRRARGFAPRAVKLPFEMPAVLAVGSELKGAICLTNGDQAFLSQHIGDLQNNSIYDSFCHTIDHLSAILEIKPGAIACDLHPDYLSSVHAQDANLPLIKVQHHHAHLAACMAENGLDGDVIGLIFDGTGYGSDETVWGGEFLVGGYGDFKRAGHFRPAPLPGGDAAVREPWRMALAYLYQALGASALSLDHPVAAHLTDTERALFGAMLEKGLNSPLTSSCGRLFDAVAALLNIRQKVSYDGQAAIELEALAETAEADGVYSFELSMSPHPLPEDKGNESQLLFKGSGRAEFGCKLDFTPIFPAILADQKATIPAAVIARRFHATVAAASVEACVRIAAECGLDRVILSGGVFQNRLLSEMVYTGLAERGLRVFTHRLVPPNDGGIALGQAAIAGYQMRRTN